jgi:hypothetical protein
MKVEFTADEKQAMRSLTNEERAAVIDQMLERVREDIEWVMAMERAQFAVAETLKAEARSSSLKRRPPPLPARVESPRSRASTREDRVLRRSVAR